MTSGHKLRLRVAKDYSTRLDLYGGALGSPRIGSGSGPSGDWWRSKEEALSDYMFSVVFENVKIDKYYTEKITDCFALGVIPVYWGTDKISDDFNSEGIIQWNESFKLSSLTPELYESKMQAVQDNMERVKSLRSADTQLFNAIKNL
jgi:hypothetical protein